MAFEGLTQRLQQAFGKVRGKGSLTEEDVKLVMREVRMALLEADVNYKVVKDFVKKATERCIGQEALERPEHPAAGHQDRQRRADGADGRLEREAAIQLVADLGLHALRPSGRGQDDDVRQAGELAQKGRQASAAGRLRHLSSGGHQAAAGRRRSGRRAGL